MAFWLDLMLGVTEKNEGILDLGVKGHVFGGGSGFDQGKVIIKFRSSINLDCTGIHYTDFQME